MITYGISAVFLMSYLAIEEGTTLQACKCFVKAGIVVFGLEVLSVVPESPHGTRHPVDFGNE